MNKQQHQVTDPSAYEMCLRNKDPGNEKYTKTELND